LARDDVNVWELSQGGSFQRCNAVNQRIEPEISPTARHPERSEGSHA